MAHHGLFGKHMETPTVAAPTAAAGPGCCRRDWIIQLLGALRLSFRTISTLKVTDLTEDNGDTWAPILCGGRQNVSLSKALIQGLNVYIFRHGRKGSPFHDWRPDIGPYVFQGYGYKAMYPLHYLTVRKIVRQHTLVLEQTPTPQTPVPSAAPTETLEDEMSDDDDVEHEDDDNDDGSFLTPTSTM
jgi:hypothetical protein